MHYLPPPHTYIDQESIIYNFIFTFAAGRQAVSEIDGYCVHFPFRSTH